MTYNVFGGTLNLTEPTIFLELLRVLAGIGPQVVSRCDSDSTTRLT